MLHLEKHQVPEALRRGYNGTKFRAEACEQVYIPSDAGLWSGGSRTLYSAIELTSGREVRLPDQELAPWDKERSEKRIPLKPGFAIVRHQMFCGKDMGLTFFVHPEDVAKLLPPSNAAELTDLERKFLAVIAGIKSSYRPDYWQRMGLKKDQVEELKTKLAGLGLLNKMGAITPAGRNACSDIRPY